MSQLELFPPEFKVSCSQLFSILSLCPEIITLKETDKGNNIIFFKDQEYIYRFEWDPLDCPPMTPDYLLILTPEE